MKDNGLIVEQCGKTPPVTSQDLGVTALENLITHTHRMKCPISQHLATFRYTIDPFLSIACSQTICPFLKTA